MRKLVVRCAALAAVGLLVAAAAFAAGKPYTGPESKVAHGYPVPKTGKGISVGFEAVANNESNTTEIAGAKKWAKKLGVNLIVLYDNVSVDKQVTNFTQLLSQGVKAIVLYPLDPKTLRGQLAQAKKQKVAVIAFDAVQAGQPVPADYTSVMLFNRDQSAFMQVQEMARVKPHAKIVILGLAIPVPALEYYVSRVRFWAPKFGLTVLGRADNPTDDAAGGERGMTGALGRFPDVEGVIAYNDPTALGAVSAARSQGKKIVAIGLNGGSDGRIGVKTGRLAATVQINTVQQAIETVNAGVDYAQGVKNLPRIVAVPPILITKANADTVPTLDQEVAAIK
jgi:ribose transport system substrate-binding protein